MYTILSNFIVPDVNASGLKGEWIIIDEPHYCSCANKNVHQNADSGRVWLRYTLMLRHWVEDRYTENLCIPCAKEQGFTVPVTKYSKRAKGLIYKEAVTTALRIRNLK